MQKYITQLLADIKNIKEQREQERKKRDKLSFYDNTKSKYENMFAEVDRYITEDPKETFSQHCGFQKIQFPNPEKLTDTQCEVLTEALDKLYLAFNIDANIPSRLPIRIRYTAMVEILDKKVFLDWFGTTSFEHCGYDYEGLCPFEVNSCDCRLNWASEVASIIQKPQSEWFDTDAMEIIWYELMSRFDKLSGDFEQVRTPNKVAVQKLLKQLALARRLIQDAMIYFKPNKTEMPEGDFVPFLETLIKDKVTFPKVEKLTALEMELLTIALHFLFGKGYYSEHFIAWNLERQYKEFVAHWSQWGKLEGTKDYFLFKMQPSTQTIFDKISKVSKYKSYDDHIMSLGKKNMDNNDELPF